MSEKILLDQSAVCRRYGVECRSVDLDAIAGIADSVGKGVMPINGLRHPSSNGGSGWFIWAGEYSEAVDFFQPTHIQHLLDRFPAALKFLGLPAGWRFQIDDKGYEDVWEDRSLLDV